MNRTNSGHRRDIRITLANVLAGHVTHWDFQAMNKQQQQDLAKGRPLPESLRLTAEQFALKLAGVKS